jgi:hypothetical protein
MRPLSLSNGLPIAIGKMVVTNDTNFNVNSSLKAINLAGF